MTTGRVEIFRELASYLRSEKIPSCVLHGINPESGELGRDLDLYIPDPRHAFRAAVHFSEILRRHKVRWISLMHPIWGPRCIGIQESDLTYWELHTIPRIRLTWIEFGELFPIQAKDGPHGFGYDPVLWFIKVVLQKHSKSFLRGRPVWITFIHDPYVLAHQSEIECEFQKRWAYGAEFISAMLGPDTEANLKTRRKGILALALGHGIAHPVNAALAGARWLYRKGNIYRCPTMPVIGIDAPMESPALQDILTEKLKRVFIKIVVADEPLSWRVRKRMQDGRYLLVFRRDERGNSQKEVDRWISIPTAGREDIAAGVAAILDCVVEYNKRWANLYPSSTSLRVMTTASGTGQQ